MGAIVNGYGTGDAAVRALEAGADTLLMPADADAAIKAVVAAVGSGRLTRQRIEESVAKILGAKERAGLDHNRFTDLEAIGDVLDDPAVNERAQEIADRAVTLVRNSGGFVPLAAPGRACYVVFTEGRYSMEGQVFAQEVRKRVSRAALGTLDPSMSRQDIDEAMQKLPACESYVVAAFSSVTSGRGSVGLGGELGATLEQVMASGKPVALVALGNPYLLRNFPGVAAYLATYSPVAPCEIAAVKALWGEMDIRGRLPVSIPGEAKIGEGIQLPAGRPVVTGGGEAR
jgi:beta-N-acetylhexosaminidase